MNVFQSEFTEKEIIKEVENKMHNFTENPYENLDWICAILNASTYYIGPLKTLKIIEECRDYLLTLVSFFNFMEKYEKEKFEYYINRCLVLSNWILAHSIDEEDVYNDFIDNLTDSDIVWQIEGVN